MPSSQYNVSILISAKDNTARAAASASKGMSGLAKAAAAAATAFAAYKSAQSIIEFAKFGAQVNRAARSLDALAQQAGTTGDAIVESMQTASNYTIDRMTAMEAANRAMLMGVADTPAEFERLAVVATQLGRAMGQDAAKSIDDFVTAAGRQSKLIADNLGLMIDMDAVQEEANRIMAENATITEDAAKKQAFLNVMLTEGEAKIAAFGDQTLTAADKMEQFDSALKDAKAIIAEEFSVSIADTFGDMETFRHLIETTAEAVGKLIRLFVLITPVGAPIWAEKIKTGFADIVGSADASTVAVEHAAASFTTAAEQANAAQQQADALAQSLDSIPREVNVFVRIKETIERAAGAVGEFFGGGRQHGGPAAGMTLLGERGPELVRLPPGSHVFSNSQSSSIVNNFNQTVNTRATSGTVRQDYAMMRALVGAA